MKVKKNVLPNLYVVSIAYIDFGFLEKDLGIKGLIVDIDNTIADKDGISFEIVRHLSNSGMKIVFLSNTITAKRAKKAKHIVKEFNDMASSKSDLIALGLLNSKPRISGFKKAIEKLGLRRSEIAMIGDQPLSDILGGNRARLYTILVDPMDPSGYSLASIISLRVCRNNRIRKLINAKI